MDSQNNFFDKRTILAIILVFGFWIAWQSYLAKKYPQANKPTTTQAEVSQKADVMPNSAESAALGDIKSADGQSANVIAESTLKYESEKMSFELSSYGMGIKNIQLKSYTDREDKTVSLGRSQDKLLFETVGFSEDDRIFFNIKETSPGVYEGTADAYGASITKKIEVLKDLFALKTTVFVSNPKGDFKGISTVLADKKLPPPEGSIFNPSFEYQEIYVLSTEKEERISVSTDTESLSQKITNVSLAGLSSQYFTAAIFDKSEVIPEIRVDTTNKEVDVVSRLLYKPATLKDTMVFEYTSYVGPKSYETLAQISPNMTSLINFGFFASIGKILLLTLKWFYEFVGNYGVAIILLTLLVRVLVLPFNIASYRSMKKMQDIQPMIKSLRERYKDEPQKLNEEMMKLMRENKVNPLGGCLPMLLQMPVFFALYQVLGQSIELYKAPFFGWILDLSSKDPFFVFPILMGVAMWFQQKITPSTMDPAQAKVMQFLPIIFSLMMIFLPSGLTLYILVSTVFGIAQQQLFMKSKKA